MDKDKEKKSLRDIIGEHINTIAACNDSIVVVTADLAGTCRLSTFQKEFPHRFYNVGIAEQNMVSFAAGLAHEGLIPYVFSMAPFISMRACEQCRTDIAYANLKVRLLGCYAGYSGGISGATHWATEDVAILSSFGGMTVMEPGDPIQAQKMLEATVNIEGPIYIRYSIDKIAHIYSMDYAFNIGKSSFPRTGNDGAFICAGCVLQHAIKAADYIRAQYGKEIRVIDMHTIKPIDRQAVIDAAKTGYVVVAQDHNVVGGLGFAAAEVIVSEGLATSFKILGCPDKFIPMAHSDYLYNKYGYDTEGLIHTMMDMHNNSKRSIV